MTRQALDADDFQYGTLLGAYSTVVNVAREDIGFVDWPFGDDPAANGTVKS